ncbi:MAG: flagellar export protein FliJ [Clostridiaceae bacterium]|nr:flagellar export protein FliJ [Clostridiaceae bacterium]
MEQYNFRLQKLLDIRINSEEKCKNEFTLAQIEKQKVEEKLDSLKDNYDKYKSVSSNDSVFYQKIKHNYLNALSFSIEEIASEVEQKSKVVEAKRDDLKEKQIERKTVETLKEKGKTAFIKEQNLKEQKQNDEFALYGYIRNHGRR